MIYEWGWIGKFLTISQLPLAVSIFILFAAAAGASLFLRRRADKAQRSFDLAAISSAGLPVLFAIYVAAVSSYGVQYNVLFTFLLFISTGLSVIAIFRGPTWLHLLGGATVALVLLVWRASSYTPSAWPWILAWIAAFAIVQLALSHFTSMSRYVIAPLFLLLFPAFAVMPIPASAPMVLFGTLFALVALIAAYAIKHEAGPVYAIAAFLAIATEGVWSADNVTPARLTTALTIYAVFALLFLAVPIIARRLGRTVVSQWTIVSTAYLGLIGHLFLLVIAAQPALAFPPRPLFVALFVLDLAIGVAALYLRRTALMTAAMAASQVVLMMWAANAKSAPWPMVAFGAAITVCVMALLWFGIDRRFRIAAIAALFAGDIVVIIAGGVSSTPLFAPLLASHLAIGIAILAVAWLIEGHEIAVAAVALLALGTALARPATPAQQLGFAGAIYALFIAYPLLLGARARRFVQPYLAAVLAGIPFFVFARMAIKDAGYEYAIGLLPLVQAALMLLLVWRLLRIEPAGERLLSRLAMTAAAALAFITVAIPLQLEKQWITIAWALEGAALVWLFRRIPHRGLLAWSGALLAAAFVRLTLNPAVLAYHPASHSPIVNWYLYTYLVSAAAFFAAVFLLPDEEAQRYKMPRSIANACGTILLFFLVNIEIADFYSTGPALTFNFFSSSLAQDLTYTIGWALFAVTMLVAGLVFHSRAARVAAIILLLVTVLKCFLHDLARLGGLYRVGSLLGLTISLLLVGVLLQRFVIRKSGAPTENPA